MHICFVAIPLEEKQVEMIVFFGEEVAENTGRVSTADLIGWEAEVNTLDKVPELGHKVLIEHPKQRGDTKKIIVEFFQTTKPSYFLSSSNAAVIIHHEY